MTRRTSRMATITMALMLAVGASWSQIPPPGPPAFQPAPGPGGPGAFAPAPVAAPTSLDQALVTIVVGDLGGAIEGAGSVAGQVLAGMDGPGLKALVGARLGDPTLAGMPVGAGLAVVVFPGNMRATYLEVAPEQSASYATALQREGQFVGQASDLLVAAPDELAMKAGTALAGEVKSRLLSGPPKPTVKATVHLDRLLAMVEPMIQMMLPGAGMMIAQQLNLMQGGAQDLPAVQSNAVVWDAALRGSYSIAKQLRQLEVEIGAPQEGIRIDTLLRATDGSNLQQFFAAQTVPAGAGDLLKILPGRGAVRFRFGYNMDALTSLVEKELTPILAAAPMGEEQKQAALAVIRKGIEVRGDAFAGDFMIPGQPLWSGSGISRPKDPGSILARVEEMVNEMSDGGGFLSFGAASTTVTLAKNVREHQGIAIHQILVRQDMGALGAELAGPMREMMGDLRADFAIVDDLVLVAIGPRLMEELIDAAKAKAHPQARPLNAEQAFGAGANGYMDFDLPAYMTLVVRMMTMGKPSADQFAPLQTMVDMLKGAPPVSAALFLGPEGARGGMLAPRGLIDKAAQAVLTLNAARAKETGAKTAPSP
ncbi:MAG TPA: hypothetical protein VM492_05310 [Sumerlaeia bacterium]|nr:hypothetical protein [Sumerlaeia bacterium]